MKFENKKLSRRNFMAKTAMAGAIFPFSQTVFGSTTSPTESGDLEIHIFSKHLQFLTYDEVGKAAADMGFDGVDLTVRPGGHVLPEQVQTELPKAINAIRKAGIKAELITTAVDDSEDQVDSTVLSVAADQKIKYYRLNWFRYLENKSIPESIQHYQRKIAELSRLNRKLGLIGCYQNHSGQMIGASLWELYDLLSKADDTHMGVQYDIRHATVEGGLSWERGLQLIRPHIKTIVLKDFKWVQENGNWKILNTPIGEGMVDFKKYFKLLKDYEINVPVCLHMEYSLNGAEHGAQQLHGDEKVVFDTMKKDLEAVKKLWRSV